MGLGEWMGRGGEGRVHTFPDADRHFSNCVLVRWYVYGYDGWAGKWVKVPMLERGKEKGIEADDKTKQPGFFTLHYSTYVRTRTYWRPYIHRQRYRRSGYIYTW